MRLLLVTLAGGALLAGCGDGHSIDGLDESGDPASGEGDVIVQRTWSDGLRLQVDPVGWVGEGELQLRLAVTDADSGAPVSGLDARSFRFVEDGEDLGPETLFDVRREQNLRVALVLDLSTSMLDAQAVEPLKAAARALVESLPRGARVGLVRFATGYERGADFTSDSAEILSRIDDLAPPDGRAGRFTNLWGALSYAADLLGEGEAGESRVAVVFTDGRDNVVETTADAAGGRLKRAGVTVYAVGLGDAVDGLALQALAGAGHFTAAAEPAALEPVFAAIGARIGELLRVTYVTPKAGGTHSLALTVDDGGRSGGVDVLFSIK